jgi:thymidylate synthase ThyX
VDARARRGVLGTAVYTEFIWDRERWSLMNWLQKRLDKGAQWEHRATIRRAIMTVLQASDAITAGAFEEYVLKR